MIRALWTSATGMQAQQLNIDVIANNLANVNTTGFKHSRTEFQDLLYQNMRAAGSETSSNGTKLPVGIQLGHGTRASAVSKDFSQGNPVQTSDDPMNVDMMVNGQGFFQVQLPSGDIAYTRDGSFHVDTNGNIVTTDGYNLVGGAIGVNPNIHTGVAIESSGSVGLADNGTPGFTAGVAQIQLARFVNPAGLTAIGNNLYKASEASGSAVLADPGTDGMGSLKQHYKENSNVSMVTEMVDMISSQRAYEINSKGIQTASDMLSLVANLKR
ncbi:MAG: flagellar basal-body rod protein FlgG [Magnetococcales bacterium]|nr:flagellar basal-body rod protein FlgG [Magnetococcales bacterium]